MIRLRVLVVAVLVMVLVVTPWNYPSGMSDKVLADDPLWFGAAGSPYRGHATIVEKTMDIVLSYDSRYSTDMKRCLALDSKREYPHILWRAKSSSSSVKIFYVHWNGSNWECANGDDYATNPASACVSKTGDNNYTTQCLALDSSDNPHITWGNENDNRDQDIFYIHWNGSNWLCADGSVYNPTANPNPANVSDNGVFDNGSHLLTLDSSDNPHIAWGDFSDIFYVSWNGSNWLCADGSIYDSATRNANISRNTGISGCPSLVLDSSDNPHIAWGDCTTKNCEIFYVHWNGSNWLCADGAVYNPGTSNANMSDDDGGSWDPSLVLDCSGNPHIAWDDTIGNYTKKVRIFYTRWNGNEWVCADGLVYDPSIRNARVGAAGTIGVNSRAAVLSIDSIGNPHIVWFNAALEIFYTRWNGNEWVYADGLVCDYNVSRNSSSSILPSLVLDSKDNPHIAWYDYGSYSNPHNAILYVTTNPNIGQSTNSSNDIQVTKDIELDGNNDFLDFGRDVKAGEILTYRINIKAELGDPDSTVPVIVEDVIPYGTEYADYMEPCSFDVFSHSIYNYTQGTCESKGKWCWDEIPGRLVAFKHSGITLRWRLNLKHEETISLVYKVKVLDGVSKVYSPDAIVRLYDRTYDEHSNHLLNHVVSPYSTSSINAMSSADLVLRWEYVPERMPIGTDTLLQWNYSWFDHLQELSMPFVGSNICGISFKNDDGSWTNWKTIMEHGDGADNPQINFDYKNKGHFYVDPAWLPKGKDSIDCRLQLFTGVFHWYSTEIAYSTITRYPAINYASWADPCPELVGRTPILLIHGFSFFGNRSGYPLNGTDPWKELLDKFFVTSHEDTFIFEKFKPYVLTYDASSSWLWNYMWKEMGVAETYGKIFGMLSKNDADGTKKEALKIRYEVQEHILANTKYTNSINNQIVIDYDKLGIEYAPQVDSIESIGIMAGEEIDRLIGEGEFPKRNFYIIGHSLGGLVGRSLMNARSSQYGMQFGHRVNKLITLATPHHGTPFANTPWNILTPSVDNPGNIDKVVKFMWPDDYKWTKSPKSSSLEYASKLVQGLSWDNYDNNDNIKYTNQYLQELNQLDGNSPNINRFDKIYAYACDLENGVDFINLDLTFNDILEMVKPNGIQTVITRKFGEEFAEHLTEDDIAKLVAATSKSLLTGSIIPVGATILKLINDKTPDLLTEWSLSRWSLAVSGFDQKYKNNDGIIPLSSALFDEKLSDYHDRSFEGNLYKNKTVLNHKSINSTKSNGVFKAVAGDLFNVMVIEIDNCILNAVTLSIKAIGYFTSPVAVKLTYGNWVIFKRIWTLREMKKYAEAEDEADKLIVEIGEDTFGILFEMFLKSLISSASSNNYKPTSANVSNTTFSTIPKSVKLNLHIQSIFDDQELSFGLDGDGTDIEIPIELEIPSPSLKINVWTDGYQYHKDDLITCKIRVSNVGIVPSINNQLSLIYPRELILVSSRPVGDAGRLSWSDIVWKIDAGSSIMYELKFRINNDVYIGESPKTISFIGSASSERHHAISDHSQVLIIPKSHQKTLSLYIDWEGINTKTSTGKVGDKITLYLKPDGGSSPYSISVDWGDGEKDSISNNEELAESVHTYSTSGDYDVEIKVTDQFGKTMYVRRILHIK